MNDRPHLTENDLSAPDGPLMTSTTGSGWNLVYKLRNTNFGTVVSPRNPKLSRNTTSTAESVLTRRHTQSVSVAITIREAQSDLAKAPSGSADSHGYLRQLGSQPTHHQRRHNYRRKCRRQERSLRRRRPTSDWGSPHKFAPTPRACFWS